MKVLAQILLQIIFVATFSVGQDSDTMAEATTIQPSTLTTRQERIFLMRRRLSMIKQSVLSHLRWSTPPTMTAEERERALRNLRQMVIGSSRENVLNEVKQTNSENLQASCADILLTGMHDISAWRNRDSWTLNVIFDVNSDSVEIGDSVEVINATLNLHVKDRSDCPCAQDNQYNRILLYIHRYTDRLEQWNSRGRGPGHQRHERITTLINVKMLVWEESKWIQVNITEAASGWVNNGGSNKGLEIVATNLNGDLIDAKIVFDQIDCFLQRRRGRNPFENQRRLSNADRAPYMELFTEVTPEINIHGRNRRSYQDMLERNQKSDNRNNQQ